MKKIIVIVILALFAFLLCGCCLKHNWVDATCTEPQTCSKCGKTNGDPLGHDWKAATCTAPKTCSNCGLTEGDPLGHDWKDATFDAPKTCTRCGATEGDPLTSVYDETGFLIGYHDFSKLYDAKLGEISDHFGFKNSLSLERENNSILVQPMNAVRICYGGSPLTQWMKGTCAIFYNGITGSLFTPTIEQVQFGYNEKHFLTNYSEFRKTILSLYASLPYTIDPSFADPDEAVSFIIDNLFEKLPNGKNIESYDPNGTYPLQGLPISCEHNGVMYTLCEKGSTLYLIATVGEDPIMPEVG